MKGMLDGYNIYFNDPTTGKKPVVDLSGLNKETAKDENNAFSELETKVQEVGKGATVTLRTVIAYVGVIALLVIIIGMLVSKRKRDEGKENLIAVIGCVILAFAAVAIVTWAMGIGASF